MHAVGFELAMSANERPQTYALGRATTGPDNVSDCNRLLSARLATVSCTGLRVRLFVLHRSGDFMVCFLCTRYFVSEIFRCEKYRAV
jgi:hypothetical protein